MTRCIRCNGELDDLAEELCTQCLDALADAGDDAVAYVAREAETPLAYAQAADMWARAAFAARSVEG
jgi:hypothetical protein